MLEIDVNVCISKIWTTMSRLTTLWKYNLPAKMKLEFSQIVALLLLLYCCTTRNLMKHLKKKLDGNYTRMLHAVLKKS